VVKIFELLYQELQGTPEEKTDNKKKMWVRKWMSKRISHGDSVYF
jgi:hypothetical protein